MGARTDFAEREVAAQRARVAGMLGDLEERVQEDAHGLGDTLSERTSSLQERVTEAAEDVPGRQTLEDQVMRRPLTMLLSGVGVGVALGVASSYLIRAHGDDGDPSDRPREPRRVARAARHREEDDGGSGLMNTLTGVAMSALAGPVKHQLEDLAREALAGFLGEQRDDSRRPGEARVASPTQDTASHNGRTLGGPQ